MAVATAVNALTADTLAAALTLKLADKQVVITRGYHTVGDGGGQEMIYRRSGWAAGGFVEGPHHHRVGATDAYLEAIDKSVFNVKHAGARGDGTTNDLPALQAAANAAARIKGGNQVNAPKVFIPASQDRYVITSQLIIPTGVELECAGTIEVQAAAGAVSPDGWVRLGDLDASVSNLDRQLRFRVSVVRQTQSDWNSESDIGVYYTSHAGGDLEVDAVGFTVGLYYSSGYGNVHIGEIRNCHKGVVISDSDHFVNASNFWGGYFACNGGVNTSKSRYGFYVKPVTFGSNSCTFYGQSYELQSSLTGGALSTAVYLDGTVDNIVSFNFYQQRVEAVNKTMVTEGDVTNCRWESSLGGALYAPGKAEDVDGEGRGNYVGSGLSVVPKKIFDTGRLVDSYYEVSSFQQGFRNLVILTNAGAAPNAPHINTQVAVAGIRANESISPVQFSGVFIDTSRYKDFQIEFELDGEQTANGTVYMIAYADAAGTATANSSSAIKTLSGVPSYNSGAFGGFFSLGTLNRVTGFSVADNVPLVFVSVHSGYYKRWSISCLDGVAGVVDKAVPPYHDAQPSAGTWKRGDFVVSSAEGFDGWLCSQSGTEGEYTGVTCNTTSGSRTVSSVANISEVTQGDYITIAGNTGVFRVLNKSGTTLLLDRSATATTTGSAVNPSPPVWRENRSSQPEVIFDNRADMLASTSRLRHGDLAITRGFYEKGDGGGAVYEYFATGRKIALTSVDTGGNWLFADGCRFHNSDRVVLRNGGGATAPAPLAFDTVYYARDCGLNSPYEPDNKFRLSETFGGPAITVTTAGSGTIFFDKFYNDGIVHIHGDNADDYFKMLIDDVLDARQAGCKPDYEYFNRGTDNAQLIENALWACAEASNELFRVGSQLTGLVTFKLRGSYRVLSQVDQIRGEVRWDAQDGRLIHNGDREADDAVLKIMALAAWEQWLPSITGDDLAYQLTSEHQERFAGILIKSASNCDVHLQSFGNALGVGLLLEADAVSGQSSGIIAYNRFYGGFFGPLRTGIELSVGPGGGFTNENNFYGQNFTFNGGESYCTRTGIKFSDPYSQYGGQNANRFYSPCFQVGGRQSGQLLSVGMAVSVNNRYFNPENWQEYYCLTTGTVSELPSHIDKSTVSLDGVSWRHVGPYYSCPVAHYSAGSGNDVYAARWEGGDGPFAMFVGPVQGVVGNNYDFVAFGGNTDRATPYLNFFDNAPPTSYDGRFAGTNHVTNHGTPSKPRTYQINDLHLQTIASADGVCIKGLNYLSRATNTWSAFSTNYNDSHVTLTRGSVYLAGGDSFAVLLPKRHALSYSANKFVARAGLGADLSAGSVHGRSWGSVVNSKYECVVTSLNDSHLVLGGSGSFSSGWYTPQADVAGLAFTMPLKNNDVQYMAFGTASGAELSGMYFHANSHYYTGGIEPFLPVPQPETRFSHGTPTEGIFAARGEYIANVKDGASEPSGWYVTVAGALAKPWTTGTSYRTGELAQSNGHVYYAQRKVSTLTYWAPGQTVSVNDIRLSPANNEAYICTTAGTTGSTDPGTGNGGAGQNLNDGGAVWRFLFEAGTSGVTAPTGGAGTEDFDDGQILWTYYGEVAQLEAVTKPQPQVVFDTLQDALAAPLNDGQLVITGGYVEVGDGGGNNYVYHSSGWSGLTTPDGLGFFIRVAATDAYLEALDRSQVKALQFGVRADTGTDQSVPLQAAVGAMLKYQTSPVLLPPGVILCNINITTANAKGGLLGSSHGTVLTSHAVNDFAVRVDASFPRGFTFERIKFVGDGKTKHGLYYNGGATLFIRNCIFEQCGIGVCTNGTIANAYHDVNVNNCYCGFYFTTRETGNLEVPNVAGQTVTLSNRIFGQHSGLHEFFGLNSTLCDITIFQDNVDNPFSNNASALHLYGGVIQAGKIGIWMYESGTVYDPPSSVNDVWMEQSATPASVTFNGVTRDNAEFIVGSGRLHLNRIRAKKLVAEDGGLIVADQFTLEGGFTAQRVGRGSIQLLTCYGDNASTTEECRSLTIGNFTAGRHATSVVAPRNKTVLVDRRLTYQTTITASTASTAVAMDNDIGRNRLILLNANTTINLSASKNGEYILVLRQDATGGRTVTWGNLSGTLPTVSTVANKNTLVRLVYSGTTWRWIPELPQLVSSNRLNQFGHVLNLNTATEVNYVNAEGGFNSVILPAAANQGPSYTLPAMQSGKVLVLTFDARAEFADFNLLVTGSLQAGNIALTSKWRTYCRMALDTNEGTSEAIYFYNTVASVNRFQIRNLQVCQFDNLDQAQKFIESETYLESHEQLGPELLVDPYCQGNASEWTLNNAAALSFSGNVAVTATGSVGYASQAIPTDIGATYVATFQLKVNSSGGFAGFRKADNATASSNVVDIATSTSGPITRRVYFRATASTTYMILQRNTASATVLGDYVSLRQVLTPEDESSTQVLRLASHSNSLAPKDPPIGSSAIYQHAPTGHVLMKVGKASGSVTHLLNSNAVTPEEFGAVGDGAGIDFLAVQLALNTGRPVKLEKTYAINNSLTASNAGQRIFGPGKLKVVSAAPGPLAAINVTAEGVSIEGITFEGAVTEAWWNANHASVPSNVDLMYTGVFLTGASNVRVTGCRFSKFQVAVYCRQGSSQIRITDCTVDGIFTGIPTGAADLNIAFATDASHVTVNNCSSANVGSFIRSGQGSEYLVCSDNRVRYCYSNAINLAAGSNTVCSDNLVENTMGTVAIVLKGHDLTATGNVINGAFIGIAVAPETTIADTSFTDTFFSFENGSEEIQPGETLTGNVSSASGVVLAVHFKSGKWSAGTATGWVELRPSIFGFGFEECSGSLSGADCAELSPVYVGGHSVTVSGNSLNNCGAIGIVAATEFNVNEYWLHNVVISNNVLEQCGGSGTAAIQVKAHDASVLNNTISGYASADTTAVSIEGGVNCRVCQNAVTGSPGTGIAFANTPHIGICDNTIAANTSFNGGAHSASIMGNTFNGSWSITWPGRFVFSNNMCTGQGFVYSTSVDAEQGRYMRFLGNRFMASITPLYILTAVSYGEVEFDGNYIESLPNGNSTYAFQWQTLSGTQAVERFRFNNNVVKSNSSSANITALLITKSAGTLNISNMEFNNNQIFSNRKAMNISVSNFGRFECRGTAVRRSRLDATDNATENVADINGFTKLMLSESIFGWPSATPRMNSLLLNPDGDVHISNCVFEGMNDVQFGALVDDVYWHGNSLLGTGRPDIASINGRFYSESLGFEDLGNVATSNVTFKFDVYRRIAITAAANINLTLQAYSPGTYYGIFKQAATGGSAFTLTMVTSVSGSAPTIATGSGAVTVLPLFYDGTGWHWLTGDTGPVPGPTLDAQSILANTTGSSATGTSLIIGEQSILGRSAGGNLAALTPPQTRLILRKVKNVLTPATPQNWSLVDGLFHQLTPSGNFTLNLPTAAAEGETAFIHIPTGGGHTVTLATGMKTLGGANSIVLPAGECRLELFFTSATTAQVTISEFS